MNTALKRITALLLGTVLLTVQMPVLAADRSAQPAGAAEQAGISAPEASLAAPAAEEPAHLENDLVILFTSDVHCGVDRNFGLSGLMQLRKYYESQGRHTLLVDDGDFIQGEALGTITKGEAPLLLMNAMKYDIAIPGNHEFDYGTDRFLELAAKADFPYISCNFNKEGRLIFEPYVIKEFDGVRFAFVGITTPKTLMSSTPRYFQNEEGEFIYGFYGSPDGSALYERVQETVDAARAEGADYVIALCHLGNNDSYSPYRYDQVIAATEGIDVLLDGHSHDTDQVVMKNKNGKEVIRSACGTKLACIGKITFGKDGSISSDLLTWDLPGSAEEVFGIQNEMSLTVALAMKELGNRLSEVVAHSEVALTIYDPAATDSENRPLRIVRNTETNLGDLVADAYRIMGNADVAIVNGGAVRADISAGDITSKDIITVNPFGNSISVSELTGQQILDALEWGARFNPQECGGFLQVSGLSYEIHTYIPNGCLMDENGMWTGHDGEYRVQNVMVGDEPLDLSKKYRVAAIDYLLNNKGDGFAMFDSAQIVESEIMLDNQALIDYISGMPGGAVGEEYADPYGQGRIVGVDAEPAK